MLKTIALITFLLASLAVLPAWGQDDSGSEDEGVEASDEFGNDEEASAADEALDEANLEDEAVLEEIANVDDADDEASEDDTSLGLTDSADVPTDTTPTDTSPTDTSGCRSPPTGTTPLYPGSSRRGTVRIFNETRGSGSITDNSTNQEIFVHASGLIDNVFPGDCVTFDVDQGRTGLQAVNVKKI